MTRPIFVGSRRILRAEDLLQLGRRGVVLKRAGRGALLATYDALRCSMPALPVLVMNTTAAGDAFNAGCAVRIMRGMSPREALRYATAAGALSVMQRGAQSSAPDAEEVRSLIQKSAPSEECGS